MWEIINQMKQKNLPIPNRFGSRAFVGSGFPCKDPVVFDMNLRQLWLEIILLSSQTITINLAYTTCPR